MNELSTKHDLWRLAAAVDAGGSIGFGHLRRCVAIAVQAQLLGAQVEFNLCGIAASGCGLVEVAGFLCRNAPAELLPGTVVLVDRVHSATLRQPNALIADISRWRKQKVLVALIDGAGEDALRRQRAGLEAHLLIAPYAGERAEEYGRARVLAGPEFAPLAAEYEDREAGPTRAQGSRILVTCGGSDPSGITALIVEGLSTIQSEVLEVRVVLGPGFEAAYCARLTEMGRNSAHTFEWVGTPTSLASHMHWCDVAVATSGLTKYELAAAGTPAILISPDDIHARANVPFTKLGTAADLGSIQRATPAKVASAVRDLLNNAERRAAMARAGQVAIDGHGASRIAKALRELAYAEV